MKKLILAILLFAFAAAIYAEGREVDPRDTPNFTLSCVYPVEREDGTSIAINEIARVEFFVSPSLTTPDWQPAGSNNAECKQVYDLTNVPDGQYYYTGITVDTDGRTSIYGADAVPPAYLALMVKRIASPKHQTGYTGIFD